MALAQAWALAHLGLLVAPLGQLFPPEYRGRVSGPLRPYVLGLRVAHLLALVVALAVVLVVVLAVPLP